jgi:hypothetical protein
MRSPMLAHFRCRVLPLIPSFAANRSSEAFPPFSSSLINFLIRSTSVSSRGQLPATLWHVDQARRSLRPHRLPN